MASSLVVATAGTIAAVRNEESQSGAVSQARANGGGDATESRTSDHAAKKRAAPPTVHPRPGDVESCDTPGTDEIVKVKDDGAPNGERAIWIRRPPGADSATRPVLYLLHGSTTSHQSLKRADIGPLLDKEMCRTGVEFVIAAPHGQEAGGSDTEWGDAADGAFKIESFVTDTAIDTVEGDHRRPRQLRAIGGFSMGGYGAAALPLRHPDLYSQAVSWAGYFKVDDPGGTFGDDTDAHAPDQLLDDPKVRDIRFMLLEGKDDHTPLQEGSINGEAKRFAGLLREREMDVRTKFPKGGHNFDTWTPTFPATTDFLVEGWSDTAE